jgi:hypothetical protein
MGILHDRFYNDFEEGRRLRLRINSGVSQVIARTTLEGLSDA